MSTSSLILNGTLLPAGRYKINTAASQLSGRGPTATPNFAGSVSVDATNADFNLGSATGSATLGNAVPLDVSQGFTLTGFRGSVQDRDWHELRCGVLDWHSRTGACRGWHTGLDDGPDMPVSFDMHLQTSLDDTYVLAAEAPSDWTVSISETGTVTLTPGARPAGRQLRRPRVCATRPVDHNCSPMPRSWCMSLPLRLALSCRWSQRRTSSSLWTVASCRVCSAQKSAISGRMRRRCSWISPTSRQASRPWQQSIRSRSSRGGTGDHRLPLAANRSAAAAARHGAGPRRDCPQRRWRHSRKRITSH